MFKKKNIPWNKNISREDIYGEKSPNWKGGRYISSDGYVMVKVQERFNLKDTAKWKCYKREHTHIMEQFLGRSLNKGEIVHHIDKNKQNNILENLYLTDQKNHRKAHDSLEKLSIELYIKGLISFNRDKSEYEFTEEIKKLCKLN